MTMDDAERRALLACPFCGGEAAHPLIKGVVQSSLWCCGCEVEMHAGKDGIPTAQEMWNRRTTPPAVGGWLPIESYPDGAEDVLIWADGYLRPLMAWRQMGTGKWQIHASHVEPATPSHWMALPEAPQPREEEA